jgi:hypothetical protein
LDRDSSEVSEGDIEAEVVESNVIFDNDGLVNAQNDYAKNICNTFLPNPGLWLGKI